MRRSSDNPVELPIHTWTAAMEQTKPAGESDWPRALLERQERIRRERVQREQAARVPPEPRPSAAGQPPARESGETAEA